MPGALTKNKQPHTIALTGERLSIIERRWVRRAVQVGAFDRVEIYHAEKRQEVATVASIGTRP